jgi:hypothetical protein
MKTGIITAAIAAIALIGTTTQSEARPHRKHCNPSPVYVSGYRSCGTPVYQQHYVSPYRSYGKSYHRTRYVVPPRVHYYRAPVCPPPVRYCPPPRPVCPPTYYHGGYPRNGVVIQGTFRL